MGMCKPSGGKFEKEGKYGRSIEKPTGDPNSRVDFYEEGKPHTQENLLQQRWYGPNGWAINDRDWKHGDSNNTHTFPHDHPWDWSKKSPRQDCLPKINSDYC